MISDEDQAELAALLRSPFWHRVEAEILSMNSFNPLQTNRGAAEQATALSYVEGVRAFATQLKAISKPPQARKPLVTNPLIRNKRSSSAQATT